MPTFTASDGTTFEDRRAFRKYEFELSYTFRNQSGGDELLQLRKEPGTIDGQPFELENLAQCEVLLLDHSEAVQADNLVDCAVLIGACCDSVFVRNCTGCTLAVACKQLRARDCHACTFYLLCNTEPAIELSSGLQFAPFHAAWPQLPACLDRAAIDPASNLWFAVHDFSDAASTPRRGGVNWRRLAAAEEAPPWRPCGPCPEAAVVPRVEAFTVPIPSQEEAGTPAAAAAGGGGGGMSAFKLGTSQADAEAAFAAAQAKPAPAAEAAPTAADGEAAVAEAAAEPPCILPLPLPPPTGASFGVDGLLVPPASPVSMLLSSPLRARLAAGRAAEVAAVEVRFLFTPGGAYRGDPLAVRAKVVASTPHELAGLVAWGDASVLTQKGAAAKVCVPCAFAAAPPNSPHARTATGEAATPVALWHALRAACLEPEPTSGSHLVAWVELLDDHATTPVDVAESTRAEEPGGFVGGNTGQAAVQTVAEPKDAGAHFAGVNAHKLALLAAPPTPSPEVAATPATAGALLPARTPAAAAVLGSSIGLHMLYAAVSAAEYAADAEEDSALAAMDEALAAEGRAAATPAVAGEGLAVAVTSDTMASASAGRAEFATDLAALDATATEQSGSDGGGGYGYGPEDAARRSPKSLSGKASLFAATFCTGREARAFGAAALDAPSDGDGGGEDLTPDVSSGDEATSSGGCGGRGIGSGCRGSSTGSPAWGAVEEASLLEASLEFVSGLAQEVEGGGKDEDGGEDDDEGEEPPAPLHVAAGGGSSPQSRYQRSEHLVAFGAVESDTSGAKEEDEEDTEKEDEHDEEEGEESEAASESGEDSGSGAANEEASLTRIEKQAPLPLAHRSAAVPKAGPPPLEPQTPAEKELVTSVLRIAHTLRLAQKHASRADSTRTARTGTGGSTSGSGDSHAADSSRVTRSGLRDGVRAVDGSQGPAMGALRDDLEAFFGFCLAGQRFRPGADGGSLSALQLHRALRDCLAQGRPHAAPYFHEQPPPPGHGAAAEAVAGTLSDALVKLYGNKASLRGNDLNKVLRRYAVGGMLTCEGLQRAAATELRLHHLPARGLGALWHACGIVPPADDAAAHDRGGEDGDWADLNRLGPVRLLDLSCVLKGHLFRAAQRKRHRTSAVLATRRAKDRALDARPLDAPPPRHGGAASSVLGNGEGRRGAASLVAWAGMGAGHAAAKSQAAPLAWRGAALTPSQVADQLLCDVGSALVAGRGNPGRGGRGTDGSSGPNSPGYDGAAVGEELWRPGAGPGGCTRVRHEANVAGVYGGLRQSLAANDAKLASVAQRSLARLDACRRADAAKQPSSVAAAAYTE